jgi:hypothetical protein
MAPRWLKWNLYGSSFKYENKFGPINDCFEEYVRKYDCFKSYEKNFLWCGVIWTLKEFSIFFMALKGKRIQQIWMIGSDLVL